MNLLVILNKLVFITSLVLFIALLVLDPKMKKMVTIQEVAMLWKTGPKWVEKTLISMTLYPLYMVELELYNQNLLMMITLFQNALLPCLIQLLPLIT